MDVKHKLTRFITIFIVSLLVSIVVTLLWSLVFHGTAIIDWETSFRNAILFGVIFTMIDTGKKMKSVK